MRPIRYGEEDWFAVPLRDGGFGMGLVAKAGRAGVLLGYFFGPRRATLPTVQAASNLRPARRRGLATGNDAGQEGDQSDRQPRARRRRNGCGGHLRPIVMDGRIVVGAFLAILVGCSQPPDNPQRRQHAVEVAARFLSAVSGGELDRGWSLLHPSQQDRWGNRQRYIDTVTGADWSTFEFRVLEAVYCDDGIWCPVAIDIPNGMQSVPKFLHSVGGSTGGIRFHDEDLAAGDAELWVVFESLILDVDGGVMPDPG